MAGAGGVDHQDVLDGRLVAGAARQGLADGHQGQFEEGLAADAGGAGGLVGGVGDQSEPDVGLGRW
ncbi:hypothetical protein GCM10020229_43140 [Kitasatospora albolonga]